MNKINLKSALMNLRKKRLFGLVNIGDLSFGMLCALFIGTYVMHEFSYDKFYPDAERIYRVNINTDRSGVIQKGVLGPTGLKPYFDESIPQVEQVARFERVGAAVFQKNQEFLKEENAFYTDMEFFDIFSIDLLEGNVTNALKEAQAIVISATLRKKYFGIESALGKPLDIAGAFGGSKQAYVVRGVYADFSSNYA